ncbi:MAG: ECF transporter S component [Defluviitaleaceae bacterium]|nr:ECF transporter S component [Defluviitaleaceae bacterium]
MDFISGSRTRKLVMAGLFVAIAYLGSNIRLFGTTIAFDSLPGFLAALILGPAYGAAIGFLGHLFTALMSGFPLGAPLHGVIAFSMAIAMLGYGLVFKFLKNKLPLIISLIITGIVGVILNGPVSLGMSIAAMTLMAGREAGLGLLVLLPTLILGAAANVVLSIFLYIPLDVLWSKNK